MLILGLLLPLRMDMYEKEWPMEGPNGWRLERLVANHRLKKVKEVWWLDKKAAKKEAEEEAEKAKTKTAMKAMKAKKARKAKTKTARKAMKAKKGPKKSKKRELLRKAAAKEAAKPAAAKQAAKAAKNKGERTIHPSGKGRNHPSERG